MAETILSLDQQRVLDLLAKQPAVTSNFYLGGGTALAEFHLHHRLSEDLDFFSEEEVSVEGVAAMLKKIAKQAGIFGTEYQQSYNRNLFMLTLATSEIKTEFTYYPFTRIEKGLAIGALAVDSLLDIAVNKVFTIYTTPRSRDFIDLYCILQKKPEWTIDQLILKAKVKFDHHIDPLQFSAQCIKAEELKDYPTLLIQLESAAWIQYFLDVSKRLAQSQLEYEAGI
jgi:predicted nucleotidyltransferase component of viral defense system